MTDIKDTPSQKAPLPPWRDWARSLDLDPRDIPAAFTLLTRLPVPADHAHAGSRGSRAAWAYPLVGAALGLLAGMLGLLLFNIGVSGGIAAALALGSLLLMTGGLHEDGLSDCADGFGGGHTIDRCLEIMKDSRIGAFGAAALVLSLLARWDGYEVVTTETWLLGFVAVGAVSRLPMVLVMFAMPLARPSGLAASVGLVPAPTAIAASVVTFLLLLLCIGLWAIPMMCITVLICLPLCALAWKRIEGFTGDVLGGCQQLAEIAALAVLTILL